MIGRLAHALILPASLLVTGCTSPNTSVTQPAPAPWTPAAVVEDYTRRAATFGWTGGMLIAEGGTVRHAAGYGFANRARAVRFGPTIAFDVGSFTKQLTAGAVLKLAEQRRLSLTDSLHRFFPSAPADKRSVTIHQLLSNTSGLAEYSGEDFELIDRAELIARAMREALSFAPGTKYAYSNVGFSLLAAIVELASGQSYEGYLREHLFLPAGMQRTGYVLPRWHRDSVARNYSGEEDLGNQLEQRWLPDGPSWNLRGNGGMLSTLEDLSRWYRVLRDGRLLSPASVQRLGTPHVQTDRTGFHYGYAAFIRETPSGREVAHGGGASYGTSMNFRWFPERDALVTFVTNQADVDPPARAFQRAIASIVNGQDVTMPPRAESAIPAPMRLAIAGTYELPSGSRFAVDTSDTVLVVRSVQGQLAGVLLAIPDSLIVRVDPGLERRVHDAIRSMARRGLDPLIGMSDPARNLQEDRHFWMEWIDTTEARLGGFRDVSTVAVLQEPRGSVIHMLATFDRGSRPIAVRVLQEGRVAWGFRRPVVEHEYRFLPLSPDSLVSHDLWYRSNAWMAVERDATGGVSGLVISRYGREVRARRTR
jgi:CubicO group peptidase (beta-lactamase class C family)